MLRLLAAVVVCACLLAGCGDQERPATAPMNASDDGRVVLSQEFVMREDGTMYVEGFLQFAEFATPGRETVQIEVKEQPSEHSLPAGRYSLTSYSRICSGNCGYLDDGQVDPCEREIEVRPGETTELVITTSVQVPCKIAES